MHDVSLSKKNDTDEEFIEGSLAAPSKSGESFTEIHERLSRHQQTDSVKHEKQLSLKYLQATTSVIADHNTINKNYQSNVSNESFGPTKSAVSSYAHKASNVK